MTSTTWRPGYLVTRFYSFHFFKFPAKPFNFMPTLVGTLFTECSNRLVSTK